jgi:hypothetical protein
VTAVRHLGRIENVHHKGMPGSWHVGLEAAAREEYGTLVSKGSIGEVWSATLNSQALARALVLRLGLSWPQDLPSAWTVAPDVMDEAVFTEAYRSS